ncbi:uncharacterized protein LOC124795377 [Schistocerca piceifrons]|uniref:uncharacterized protein LOC124795377 n=1 Tax=Schistocerca piceifrons TaxID=274613 RepID=UPI001F5EBB6B|nr:uncharacterized protein LOC124795377 [Schistocerca piceifrons]
MAAFKLLLLVGCFSAACATESSWDGLRVRWSVLGLVDIFHLASFFDMPKTVSDATSDGWVAAVDSGVTSNVTTYCMEDDPRVCMLYDANGIAAGIDVSVLVDDVSGLDVDYDWDSQEMFVRMERFGVPIYRTRVYWVSEDELNEGRSTWKNGLGSGLWFEGKNGRLEIPIEQAKIESDTPYTEQACIPTMGTHYYYNMTETSDCSQFFPYFLLVDGRSGKLHGVGFQTYGKASKKSRNWFEAIPTAAIKPTVPHSPDCLVDWVDKVGVISLHVYFKDNEKTIGC